MYVCVDTRATPLHADSMESLGRSLDGVLAALKVGKVVAHDLPQGSFQTYHSHYQFSNHQGIKRSVFIRTK